MSHHIIPILLLLLIIHIISCSHLHNNNTPSPLPISPLFHFHPPKHFMNDPNGLVYFNHTYHMFFQYNPYGNTWGNMSWGHATSHNLVDFQFIGVPLKQRTNFHNDTQMIFSGSATVIEDEKSEKSLLYLMYTGNWVKRQIQDQNLAYSEDGINFHYLDAYNPVIDEQMTDFRDPKFVDVPAQLREDAHHIVALAVPLEKRVRFYASVSDSITQWRLLSEFTPPPEVIPGIVECPDLILIPGNSAGTRDSSSAGTRGSSSAGTRGSSPAGTRDSSSAGTSGSSPAGTRDSSPAATTTSPPTTPPPTTPPTTPPPTTPPQWKKYTAILIFSVGTGYQYGSTVFYYTGTFNSTHFIPFHEKPKLLDHGPDYYAAVTFNNIPNGETILQGWASNWFYANEVPTMKPWRNMQAVARSIQVKEISSTSHQLIQQPVEAVKTLRSVLLANFENQLIGEREFHVARGKYLDIVVEFEALHEPVELLLRASPNERTVLRYDPELHMLSLDRSKSGDLDYIPRSVDLPLIFNVTLDMNVKNVLTQTGASPSSIDLRVLVDDGVVEVFACGGSVSFTSLIFPRFEESVEVILQSDSPFVLKDMKVYGMGMNEEYWKGMSMNEEEGENRIRIV